MKRSAYQFFAISCLTLFLLMLMVTAHASLESQIKVAEGRYLLFNNGNYTTAGLIWSKVNFLEAVELDPNDNEARLFLSITRIPALMDNTLSYTPGLPIENAREFLDSLGVSTTGRDFFNWTANFTKDVKGNITLPPDVPALREYQNFIKSGILPEVDNALSDLAGIPNSFNTILKASETGENHDIEVDNGDVLLYKTSLYTFKTFLLIILSYNINVNDADVIVTKINNRLFNVDKDLLSPYPQFFNLLADSASSVQTARSSFLSAIDTYFQASNFIRNETDNQEDDLIILDSEKQAAESDFRANLERIKDSLVNKVSVEIGHEPLRVNFSEFFEDPVNIRDHLPVFKYDPYTNKMLIPDVCTVPDRTFSGILPNGLPNCTTPPGTFPVLSVSPANRDVAKDAGTTTFSVSNTGTGTMTWSASVTSGSWLTITSGATGTDTGTINCSFTANTSTSARTATIRVIATGTTGSPVDVTVTQVPTPVQPILLVGPANRDVAKDAGTTTFSVSNTGTGVMTWSASVTSGSWLTITSGTTGTDTGTINCSFTANTSTSSRTATIRVTATGATGSPVDVTVTQVPTPVQPVLSVSPANRDVAKDAGTATFSVSNTGTGIMTWSASVTSGSWLTITSGASGTDTGTINCSFTANTGSSPRTATVMVTATGATGSPVDVTVTQAPTPVQPVLLVSPANRDVAKEAGTTTFNVSNTGTGTMIWSASVTSGSWLTITSGTSGTNTGTISCSFTANTSTSARTATIRVTATGATSSPVDVTVTQAPTPVPVLSVTPSNQAVAKDAGTTTFSVSNTGTGTMLWTAAVTTGGSWLSITTGASGSNAGTITCSFTANTSTSARTGTIHVTAGATGSPKDVTVTQAESSSGSLAVSFSGLGLWVYNSDSAVWMQVNSTDPENMIYSGSTLYANFGTLGLWKWDGAAWSQLTPADPENMVTAGSTLYVDFGASYGLWKWDSAAWSQLTPADPENMVASGSTLYVDFGVSYGLWKWDGAAWSQLTPANPENMVASGSTLYGDFGVSYGLYKWDGAAWSQLTSANPENMAASGLTLYVDFGVSYGLYKWDGAAWSQLTSANPENIVTSDSSLYVDFGASYGIYKWDGAAWSQLASADPENIVTLGSMLYGDFGVSYGLWKWDGSSWTQLTGSNPVKMAVSN
jgi:hypothetical protein